MASKESDFLMAIVAEAFNPNNPTCIMSQLHKLDARIESLEELIDASHRTTATRLNTKLALVAVVATVISAVVQPIIGAAVAPPVSSNTVSQISPVQKKIHPGSGK
jgi:uncharacterized alpha-E superfamily protein